MEASLRELLDLVVRWVHLIAGIMWIGNSMLFNWLDRNLEKEAGADELFEGRIWMVHSGGFYDVVKKQLKPNQLPDKLHWFKWQNGVTWLSGISLLVVVYYLGGGALLVDPSVSSLSPAQAIGVGVGSLVVSWLFYDLLWRSPLGKNAPVVAAALFFAYLVGLAFGLTHLLSGRAAYIHVGVVMGTLMTGNVWMVIIPSQRELVAATREGRAQDPALGKKAKQRSIHNNYLTFPLLFIMISNHFPSTYGNALNWVVLAVVGVGGALVRHFMNIRFTYPNWLPMASGVTVATLCGLFVLTKPAPRADASTKPRVAFASAHAIIEKRCQACHSDHPTDDVWKVAPSGIKFDTPEQIHALAPRILVRAVQLKTMPLANKTGITDDERQTLGDWIEQGANVQ